MNSIATAISNGRTDTSFVDDLNALRGTVNSRVALLLRSIEVHPLQLRCVVLSRTHPSTFPFSGTTAHAGVFDMAAGARRCYKRLCANSLKNTSPRRMKLRRAVLAHSLPFLLSRRNKSAMTIASTATSAFFDSRHLSRRFPRPPPFFLSFTHTRVFST